MLERTQVWLVFSLLFVASVKSRKIHLLYWNTTNSIFQPDNNLHIVDINRGNLPLESDQLNIICPLGVPEKHIIYSVSQQEFQSCRILNPRPKIVAVCDRPRSFKYFTITFRSFSPSPGGLEFKPGRDYYFISTSYENDIQRKVGGYCFANNMKMVFRVADNNINDDNNNNRLEEKNSVNVNKAKKAFPVKATTPKSWSRQRALNQSGEYIYYYKPWGDGKKLGVKVKHVDLKNNVILNALRMTSSSSHVSWSWKTMMILSLLGIVL